MKNPHIMIRIFYALFIVALAVLVICNMLVLQHLNLRIKATDKVNHSYEILNTINQGLLSLAEAEKQKNNYFITNQIKYKRGYDQYLNSSLNYFNQIEYISVDDPSQVTWTRKMESYLKTIQAQQIPQKAHDSSETIFNDIKLTASSMIISENKILQERIKNMLNLRQITNKLVITSVISSYLVLIICFLIIIRLSNRYAGLKQEKIALMKDKIQAEQMARDKLELILEVSNMGCWDLNLNTMQAERTLSHDKIFGYQALVPGWSYEMFLKHVHPDDKEWVNKKFRLAVASRQSDWELECRIIRSDNQVRRIWAIGRFYRDTSPPHLVGLVTDITETQKTEERLGLLNTILESTMEYSIIPLDLNWNILSWNEGAKFNYGYEANEIIGKNIKILSPPEDVQSGSLDELHNEVKLKGKAQKICERIRKNGLRFTAAVSINATRDRTGNILGYSLISRDITEQKKIDDRLKLNERIEIEKNRIKSEFIANMSHELRTPLNAIMGFTQLMQLGDAGPLTHEQKEFLQEIMSNSNHLLQLINDVLDISKIEAGKLIFYNTFINLQELIADLEKTFGTLLKETQINFQYYIDPKLNCVHSDSVRLKQVIFNFLSNAIKFTPKNGTIKLRILDESPTMFRIEVEDNGIGIKPNEINKLFVKFEQLNHEALQQHIGSGLGLALTKNIVEAQGGKVGVFSAPGNGSCFFAILPKYFNNKEVKLKPSIII